MFEREFQAAGFDPAAFSVLHAAALDTPAREAGRSRRVVRRQFRGREIPVSKE